MNEQQPIDASTHSDEQRGMDRRRFLLGTTAVTAGAWAAPSIFTIDRAFAADTGTPCPCADNRQAVSVAAAGTIAGNTINQVQCPNEGQDYSVGDIGSLHVANAECQGCTANIEVTQVQLLIAGTPVSAGVLKSHVRCCPTGSQGGSSVLDFQAGSVTFSGSQTQTVDFPGTTGTITFNEQIGDEFNAVHIEIPDDGGIIDLKLASSSCTPAA